MYLCFKAVCVCVCVSPRSVQTDAWFEVISVVMDLAIWHTKHAAQKASSDRYNVYTCTCT